MKRIAVSAMMVALILVLSTAAYAADDDVTVTIENNIVTVTNAPENSTLVTAFYKEHALADVRLYKGSGTITADIAQGAANSDTTKLFLWDMSTIQPLHAAVDVSVMNKIMIEVNGQKLTATLADNSSAKALRELLMKAPITIEMHDYGGFEKVGALGTSLPRNDEQITTQAGDLILYQGDQITIYYDTNSWNFTRLGKIDDVTQSELKKILGTGNVTVTLSLSSMTENPENGGNDGYF